MVNMYSTIFLDSVFNKNKQGNRFMKIPIVAVISVACDEITA